MPISRTNFSWLLVSIAPGRTARTFSIAVTGSMPNSTQSRAAIVPARPSPPRQWTRTSEPLRRIEHNSSRVRRYRFEVFLLWWSWYSLLFQHSFYFFPKILHERFCVDILIHTAPHRAATCLWSLVLPEVLGQARFNPLTPVGQCLERHDVGDEERPRQGARPVRAKSTLQHLCCQSIIATALPACGGAAAELRIQPASKGRADLRDVF